jgi:hypothetical protein
MFIYVVTIIIISFILVYGYNAIFAFKQKSDQVSYIQFKNRLQNSIEVLSVDYGSVQIKEFILPGNINAVCFIRNFPSVPVLSSTEYPLIEDSVNSGIDKNVFLIGKTVEESFFVGKISAGEDMLCVPVVQDRINLRMEGKGDHTFISSS